jgi:hypothetical protein
MIGGVMKAAAAAATSTGGSVQAHLAALGPALSQAKTLVLEEVGAGALPPLNPLVGDSDPENASVRHALAERLRGLIVEGGSMSSEYRAWVQGLWAAEVRGR